MDELSLTDRLRHILNDVVLYRHLLHTKGTDAQALLDLFQSILDSSELDTQFRRLLIVAAQRLSRSSGLYPICYELKGVKQECDPVTAGGFADIYKGEFEGHPVCLKAIRIYQDSQLEHLLKQFSREVILWGQLSHSNVLPMYGLYRFKKRLCFVAPWMGNGDIANFLKRNPLADRYSLARDVARGLKYLHMHRIVHGDLKGPNVLVDDFGRARLCDFGISSVSDPDIIAWTSLSTISSKGGSLRWQAPELLDIENEGCVRNSTLSDVYALGCVYYEIFTGNIPFYNISRDSSVTVLIQRGSRPSRPLRSSSAWQEWGLTEITWALMQDCWNNRPLERPTIEQIIDRLWLSVPLHQTPSRRVEVGGVPSSICFRARTREPLDGITKSALDKVFCNLMQSAIQRNIIGISASKHLHRVPSLNKSTPLPPQGDESAHRDIDNDLSKTKLLTWTSTVTITPTEFSPSASISASVNGPPPTDTTLSKSSVVTANMQGSVCVQHGASNVDYHEPGSIKLACTVCGTTHTHSPSWRRALDGEFTCEACVLDFEYSTRNTLEGPARTPFDQESSFFMGLDQCQICFTTETPFWERNNTGEIVCSTCDSYYKLHRPGYHHAKESKPEHEALDMTSISSSISHEETLADYSPLFVHSEKTPNAESADLEVIKHNNLKRQWLRTGEFQSTASSVYNIPDSTRPSMPSTFQHLPILFSDDLENRPLDFTGTEALPMVRSTGELSTDFHRDLHFIFSRLVHLIVTVVLAL